ncbi:prepilin peptidase [Candidatus Woesearchaeota archaeon]|jgi:prepilin signal peptidase PulO-like enzyme (type II secretory pathway)|nr:prepilin peptidase [Candidatus Woesearchaeota archaeon]MBT3537813.1 prepilin peptidase [Candidatus Woesearchaeota archaeon]MBT4697944.1 prepilin peptidase [Candidatus Woesearchaeota archaeon]MBT7105482.1 prepilin peptidase [Candidatus Woesearchaeota archaeon]MBT7931672.1 prepilin peptidase [Candidatus Woesearchaeota archaeon]
MSVESLPLAVALCFLLIASLIDFKTREVPDTLNFGLLSFAIGYRLILSLVTMDYMPLVEGAAGFIAFFILALIMFYAGQWGGGDSKMLMALGALVGIPIVLDIPLLLHFIVNVVFFGALWGFLFAIVKALLNRKEFNKEFKKIFHKTKVMFFIAMAIFIALIVVVFIIEEPLLKLFFILLAIMAPLMYSLFAFTHAVEKSCMHVWLKPNKLTLGDWIVKDIKHKGKLIASKKDLGLTEEQIAKIKKLKIKKVLVKEGIPFVPSFFIAFVVTICAGSFISIVL